jgi:hypothetical protein
MQFHMIKKKVLQLKSKEIKQNIYIICFLQDSINLYSKWGLRYMYSQFLCYFY